MSFSIYLKVIRSQALMISVLPVVACFLYGKYHYAPLNIKGFVFVGISAVLFHLAVNSISEYRDFSNKIDDPASEYPKYKLVKCDVKPRRILYIGIAAFIAASASGIFAVCYSSFAILIAGLAGAFISLFYSEWPIAYKYKAFGELAVFFAYGPLLVFSCLFALSGKFAMNDFLFSIPIGLLATSVLTANNIRDYDYDLTRIKTLATVLGLRKTYALLFFTVNLAFLLVPILIFKGGLPKSCFLVLAAYPVLFLSIKRVGSPKFIDVFGVLFVAYCVNLCIALWISSLN